MVGFVIPLLPRFLLRLPPAGPLCSAGVTPLRRYYGPIRQALAFAALRLSARAATLLPRVFSTGRGALPCFHPWPWACRRPLPRRMGYPKVVFGEVLLSSPRLSRLGIRSQRVTRPRPGVHSSLRPAHSLTPLSGLCRWASPQGSPPSVPSELCGLDLLPLRDFHPMDPWVPPGITQTILGGRGVGTGRVAPSMRELLRTTRPVRFARLMRTHLLLRSTLLLVLVATMAVAKVRQPIERALILSEHPRNTAPRVYVGGPYCVSLRRQPRHPNARRCWGGRGTLYLGTCWRWVLLYPRAHPPSRERFPARGVTHGWEWVSRSS